MLWWQLRGHGAPVEYGTVDNPTNNGELFLLGAYISYRTLTRSLVQIAEADQRTTSIGWMGGWAVPHRQRPSMSLQSTTPHMSRPLQTALYLTSRLKSRDAGGPYG